MRWKLLAALLLTLFAGEAFLLGPAFARPQPRPQSQQRAQHKSAPGAASQSNRSGPSDQLGMTCTQILQMDSTAWVMHFDELAAEKTSKPPAKSSDANNSPSAPAEKTLLAVAVYGKCYDERTDRLAASLAKSRKGPPIRAQSNFRDFEHSLQSFTAKALAESQPPADAVKSAYAALYEKQFRYAFYQSYDHPVGMPSSTSESRTAGTKTDVSAASRVSQPRPQPPTASTPAASLAPSETPSPAAAAGSAPPRAEEVDPVTLAKNHFGELLGDLPDDNMHDLHASFGEVLVRNSVGATMQLSIYRYAIFLLEPPAPAAANSGETSPSPANGGSSDQPFAPPPF